MIKVFVKGLLLYFMIQAYSAQSDQSNVVLKVYKKEAQKLIPDFKEFSIKGGRLIYTKVEISKKDLVSCSTCHTSDPRKVGRTRANKDIEPLAPVINPNRFTNYKKVEKWFSRNCKDVLNRPCTLQEKGDFITYLMSVK